MNNNIYVNNHHIIETYLVDIDEEKFLETQCEIDTWNGKGKLRTRTNDFLPTPHDKGLVGKKIEIISQKLVGKEIIYFDLEPSDEPFDMYDCQYYAYERHPLSELCDTILKDYESLS